MMTTLDDSPRRSNLVALDNPGRKLQFHTLADILEDVESLASQNVTSIGQWTAAQNIDHVRRLIHVSHAGADFKLPWAFRAIGRFMKSNVLNSKVKPGMKTVPALQPPTRITMDQALESFREEIRTASRPGAMSQPSPLLGKMSHEDWERLHCRHAEHHFGFIVPVSNS